MTEREKLLGRVRMYDFALVEVIEYLVYLIDGA